MKRLRILKRFAVFLGILVCLYYAMLQHQRFTKSASLPCLEGRTFEKENAIEGMSREVRRVHETGEIDNIYKTLVGQLQRRLENYKKRESILRQQLQLSKRSDNKVEKWKTEPILPTIYMATPTHKRFVQKAELTRVWQAVRGVKNIHWIVVEDSLQKTELVRRFLNKTGLNYTHLHVRTPEDLRRRKGDRRRMKPRGLEQRNFALSWIRENVDPYQTKGVLYFADDDNTYDTQLFEEMRFIKGVGAWPVAFTGAARWAGPICRDGHVIDFHTNWGEWRPFPIDMAGFAININKLIVEFPEAQFVDLKKPGMLESSLLHQITSIDELEPMAGNCTKVYVWHTRSEIPSDSIRGERNLIADGRPSDPNVET